jgi:hypothetical protein
LMPIMIFMTRYFHSSNISRRFTSVSHNILSISRLTVIALLVYFTTSCEEGPTKIGADMLPESDFVAIKSIDTLSACSYTVYENAIRSDNPSLSYLGSTYDPYFGTTTADFVTQIRLGGAWSDEPFTIDSIKLVLHLLTVKGVETGATHYLTLSEISEQIYTDSTYYSNKSVPLTGFKVSGIELPALRADTINDIEVRIPYEFGTYITRDTTQFFYSNTKADFRTYFKGLYFQMSSGSDPLLVSLSLAQPSSIGDYYNFFVLYMHDNDGVLSEYYFILDATNKNASYNRFVHNFNTASPGKKLTHINDGYRDTLAYLQGLNGVYTKITFPGIEKLKNDPSMKGIAINKARLIFPVTYDGDIYKASTVPSKLYLRYRASDGTKYFVPDYSDVDATYHAFFDGNVDTTNNVYKFNIGTYLQGYLEDATGVLKPELELFQAAGTNNVILKANNSKTPPKFEFTYTKF